jgi:hypothetical protein
MLGAVIIFIKVKERTLTAAERPVKAIAYLNAKLDQETAHRSPGTPKVPAEHLSSSMT